MTMVAANNNGNLIACSTCGVQIAKSASSCPSCGARNTWVHPEILRFQTRVSELPPAGATYGWTSTVITGMGPANRGATMRVLSAAIVVLAAGTIFGQAWLLSIGGILMAVACAMMVLLRDKGIPQCRMDFSTDPHAWSSNDESYWAPLRGYFNQPGAIEDNQSPKAETWWNPSSKQLKLAAGFLGVMLAVAVVIKLATHFLSTGDSQGSEAEGAVGSNASERADDTTTVPTRSDLSNVEGVWDCETGMVAVLEAGNAVKFTYVNLGVGPFTLEFSSNGQVAERFDDGTGSRGSWEPGSDHYLMGGDRHALIRIPAKPNQLYVLTESGTQRATDGIIGSGMSCRFSRSLAPPAVTQPAAPLVVTPFPKRSSSSGLQPVRLAPIEGIEGAWNCEAEGEVRARDADGTVIFTSGSGGDVGPLTIEFSADGQVRERRSGGAIAAGNWTPGSHTYTIGGYGRTLLRGTEHPDRLYVRDESSTRREADGLAGVGHECQRSGAAQAVNAPVTATSPLTPRADEPPSTPSAEPVVVPPSMEGPGARVSQPPYPPASRRKGETGQVVLRIEVLPNGRVGAANVESSTGFPDLDAAAVQDVQRNWRFVPGTSDGVPSTQWKTVKLNFGLSSAQ